ncbi:FAD-dependent oxidoreductase [Pseudonocardia endophytica]|uniref:2-polyprenyl-6-methoxyphenol hydroxylase-like FAD-dependent oxidoreductase n=1 Tax=Pseudonocardia endophytica TaxID=401976 RepID=A0A4R1HXW8_PSEEN|nr:FAD-dependent monooxygenase [Pseudonocardia endophytica]TCK22402.1 2-polyprenyl-6-methoxyphenol hydroxylase-like FAD-dependent oxidoreductase [Pseudonocardia endophytica]
MRVAIIGCGPTGLFLGAALARRGHEVTAVDRDGGPAPDGTWARRGVMQFHHAHGVRPQVGEALLAEIPEAYAAWEAAGAEPITFVLPDGRGVRGGMRSRRETFERALRQTVTGEPGLQLRQGHVDEVLVRDGRAVGLRVDGAEMPADLVIDASGRTGRVTRDLRPEPAVYGDTGVAYVDRQYRLLPGAEPGPMTNPLAWQADLDGYQVIVFLHEDGIFSVLIVRPVEVTELAGLRHEAAFEAACRAIPGLAAWTDPARAEPITPVLAGGRLINRYQGQARPEGLVLVGDAVCTTTPMFGRGLATSMMQARELLRLVDEAGGPPDRDAFEAWCDVTMRPWVDDHVRTDATMRHLWDGGALDLDAPLPAVMILAAAEQDPEIRPALGPYLGMIKGPDSLADVEERARAVYRSGWSPTLDEGPDRRELCAIVQWALAPV